MAVSKARGVSVRRAAALTCGLALAGAIAGGLSGGLAALFVVAIGERALSVLADPLLFGLGAALGAPLGAILLPIAGWMLMRHVPLGRAFAGTITGTLVGGLCGWFVTFGNSPPISAVLGGLIGFSGAVFLLRRFAGTRRQASDPDVSSI